MGNTQLLAVLIAGQKKVKFFLMNIFRLIYIQNYLWSLPYQFLIVFLKPFFFKVCDVCHAPDAGDDKSHPGSNAVDGDRDTWWQSPTISRGLKYNRVDLSINLQQSFQVAYVVVTMANSPR